MSDTSQRIGASAALALARAGADVVVGAPASHEPTWTVRTLRGRRPRADPIAWDGEHDDHTSATLGSAIERFGHIDILVHAAEKLTFNRSYLGIRQGSLTTRAEASLLTVDRACDHIGRHMTARRAGSVIIITAPATIRPWPDITASTLTAALIELTKCRAEQWAPHGVRINAISPGTLSAEAWSPDREMPPAATANAPRNAANLLEGITDAVLWLASDAARNVTGAHIAIDDRQHLAVADDPRRLLNDILVRGSHPAAANCGERLETHPDRDRPRSR